VEADLLTYSFMLLDESKLARVSIYR